ncbi:hypothetical protein SDC9_178583 [bioreactor metagenome]|uniref:Uncharacterized protein n=1 Tax=bioreactor metagenome TaxID=1076179 RepID=A0A645GZE9_9ZZZZ
MKGGRPSKANASSEKQKKQMLLRKAKKADTVSDTDTESVSENNTRENPESDFTLAAPAVANNVFSFTEFWEMYAFKVDRSKCEAKYRRLTPAEREAIKAALPRYVAGTFIDGRYPSRKNPLTWINGRCWLDEAVPIPHNGGGKVIPEQTQPETQDMPMYKAGL